MKKFKVASISLDCIDTLNTVASVRRCFRTSIIFISPPSSCTCAIGRARTTAVGRGDGECSLWEIQISLHEHERFGRWDSGQPIQSTSLRLRGAEARQAHDATVGRSGPAHVKTSTGFLHLIQTAPHSSSLQSLPFAAASHRVPPPYARCPPRRHRARGRRRRTPSR